MTTRRSFQASKTRREVVHATVRVTGDCSPRTITRRVYPEPGTRCPDQWRRSGVDVMASRQSGKVCSSRVCPRNVNASSLADRRATMSPRMVRRSGNVPDDTQHDVSRRDAGRALRTCKSCGPGLAQHPGRETSSSARLRWPGKCPVSCQVSLQLARMRCRSAKYLGRPGSGCRLRLTVCQTAPPSRGHQRPPPIAHDHAARREDGVAHCRECCR